MPSTRPSISDDAVMVATVAEPVASRISTAITQASSDDRDVGALGPVGQQRADAGVDQHLLEAAAGRDDQDDARDRRQAGLDALGDLVAASSPRRDPRVNMPTMTAISRAISGVPRTVEDLPEPLVLVVDEDVDQRLAEHQHDGQQHAEQRDAERRPAARSSRRPRPNRSASNVSGASTTTQRAGQLPEQRARRR